MPNVVVAASYYNPQPGEGGSSPQDQVAVIDFTNPAAPTAALVLTTFVNCAADCFGTFAAVGNYYAGQVNLYDITDPANPTMPGPAVETTLVGVGAISCDGTNVLAGEIDGSRVVLIDASDLASPKIVSTFTTKIESISSLSLKGSLAVVCGPNQLFFVVLDYATPTSPTQVAFTPGSDGIHFDGPMTCDLDGTLAAFGDDTTDGKIYLFDVSGGSPSFVAEYVSDQPGITSVSVSGNLVAAASAQGGNVTIADFSDPANPTGADSPGNVGLGVTVKLAKTFVVAGAIDGTQVDLLGLSGLSASLLGSQPTSVGPVTTIGYTSFDPQIEVTPSDLAFGAVRVETTATGVVVVSNTGNAPLTITGLTLTTTAGYTVSPSAPPPAIAPGGSVTLSIIFGPVYELSYSAQLNIASNDPVTPAATVTLSGTGAVPEVSWSPAALEFGNVEVGTGEPATLMITNAGAVPLTVAGMTSAASEFAVTTAVTGTLAVGHSSPATITFTPPAADTYQSVLTFLTDDPSNPTVRVSMVGTGEPAWLSWTPTPIDLGTVPPNSPTSASLALANAGPVSVNVTSLAVTSSGTPAAGTFTLGASSETIASGQTVTLEITFNPTIVWPWGYPITANLSFQSTDPAHPRVTVPVSGSVAAWGCLAAPAAAAATAVKLVAARTRRLWR
jgi:hypothetical protein